MMQVGQSGDVIVTFEYDKDLAHDDVVLMWDPNPESRIQMLGTSCTVTKQ